MKKPIGCSATFATYSQNHSAMSSSRYALLDDDIYSAIANGFNTKEALYARLYATLREHAKTAIAPQRNGSGISARKMLSGRLQAIRRDGRITYDDLTGWQTVVDLGPQRDLFDHPVTLAAARRSLRKFITTASVEQKPTSTETE